jgi:hypothetical protein
MSRLEDLTPNASVQGIMPNGLVTVVNVQWHGSEAIELTYKTAEGKVANELLYRHDEPRIAIMEQGRPWSFDGDSFRGPTHSPRTSIRSGARGSYVRRGAVAAPDHCGIRGHASSAATAVLAGG